MLVSITHLAGIKLFATNMRMNVMAKKPKNIETDAVTEIVGVCVGVNVDVRETVFVTVAVVVGVGVVLPDAVLVTIWLA